MINLILPIRVVQGVFAIIVLGLSASVVDSFADLNLSSDPSNFMVFNAIWTFLALGYLVATPMFFPNLHNRWAVVAAEAVTMIFWFSGFIAQAAQIRSLQSSCSSSCPIATAQASAAFGAFEWVAWSASLGLVVHAMIQFRKGLPEADAGNHNELDIEINGGLQQQRHPQQSEDTETTYPTTNTIHETSGAQQQQQQIYESPPTGDPVQMPKPAMFGGHGEF